MTYKLVLVNAHGEVIDTWKVAADDMGADFNAWNLSRHTAREVLALQIQQAIVEASA